MTIPPPFPSQDLAKLVLGYLAEEQLMTAYDEFLQASPYLDALQNEYDRIFMTSLKSILAEYRAVKIYVETCKPILLRKKIFQCTNLLDIVKLLVNSVDLNKIQEAADKSNPEKQYGVNPNKSNTCETCSSSKLPHCVCCKPKTLPSISQSNHVETTLPLNSIETTSLADLPGNHVTTRKKLMKVLEKDSVIFSDGQNSDSGEKESLANNICVEDSHLILPKNDNSTVKRTDLSDSRKEFDNVLKSVLDKNNTVTGSENKLIHRVSNASTFQDFASGVSGGESQNSNVPDSSTSESMNIQVPLTKDYHKDNAIDHKCQLLLQVSQRNDNIDIQTCRKDKLPKYARIRAKPDDQKVKILSDVKVSNKKKTLKNATSTPVTTTPLVQMKTIVINGTQAYNHTPVITQHTYTKDEIMAMPTLIVVPAAGPSKMPISAHSKPIMTQTLNAANASSTASLSPLFIDVPKSPAIPKQPDVITKLSDFNPDPIETGLVKTVDLCKNASVPKDSVTSAASKTPHVLPPVRKSSSTPRRTTHVRVLDFATPRRILHENINEQVTSQTTNDPAEIVLSSSPNVSFVNTNVAENTLVNSNIAVVNSNTIVQEDEQQADTGSVKENTTSIHNPSKKSNWDADLRAIVAYDSTLGSSITRRKNNTKKKKALSNKTENIRSSSKINSPKIKKASKKRRDVIAEDDDAPSDTPLKTDVPLKPTINILSGGDRGTADLQPVVVQDIKKNGTDVRKPDDIDGDCDTPEGDRLSLQNVIGAKLNISDLLETPYKQALYDLQMGTPRFLSDLPGEPLSDIKITSIPTPRFLDTPKPVQATPSWSSRPTDYSSGGSYYKPDDQDYMPMPDLRCVVSSSSKEDITADKSIDNLKDDEKKSRPQRQCTKNVSYYRFGSSTNRIKEADDTIEGASTCSESTGPECKNNEHAVKTPRDKSRSNKSETRKRASSKKKKSPSVKETQKPSVKIKPRPTPTKLTPSRHKKKIDTPSYPSPIKPRRIRTISKTVNSLTPLVVAGSAKSRRKSSTPRKLHCTESFNSKNSNHTSPETTVTSNKNAASDTVSNIQDSDAEQIALRWSDDGSQDTKNDDQPTTSTNECEDISQIQEYIQITGTNQPHDINSHGSFHVDLVKRGFDVETAKIIERDLLDTPPPVSEKISKTHQLPVQTIIKEPTLERSIETDSSATNDLQIVQDEIEEDEVELSVSECNEESQNYIAFCHDDTKEMSQEPPIRLKDSFSMNICIDDGVTVRLRATQFTLPLDQEPMSVEEIDYAYNYKETEMAVNSITNMERLYTPLKDSFKDQCYEIFDSTLTSLDTPLKANSPKRADCGTSVSEIVLEKKQIQKSKDLGLKKRKRSSGSEDSTSEGKKTKYLFTSASIQNIDIESVLTKLHGP